MQKIQRSNAAITSKSAPSGVGCELWMKGSGEEDTTSNCNDHFIAALSIHQGTTIKFTRVFQP
jgi:hypothetical protein